MTRLDFSRRTVLTGAAAALVASLPMWPEKAHAAGQLLRLPAPTGPFPVGTRSLHLIDLARTDPLAPQPRPRELMVTLWYPAKAVGPAAPYLTQGVSALLAQQLNALIGSAYLDSLLTFATPARCHAPALPGRRPTVFFSPGQSTNVAFYSGMLQDLASKGFTVAGVDHTFDAIVEFPGGRIEVPAENPPYETLLAVRVADLRFAAARLAGLGGPIAAMGHSLGSMTAIGALAQEGRFAAGIAIDGNPLGEASLRQPFLMMGNPSHRRATDPVWSAFYDRLRGPRLHLVVDGSEHYDFSDLTVFNRQIDLGGVFELGSIDGRRAMRIARTYPAAWLSQALRGSDEPLLRGESPAFPEVDFQP